jgi:hypothetical protein
VQFDSHTHRAEKLQQDIKDGFAARQADDARLYADADKGDKAQEKTKIQLV